MKKTTASLMAMTLALTGGLAVTGAYASPLPNPDTLAEAPRAGRPTVDDAFQGPVDEPRRVMVLLKEQPTGKGNESEGLAAVDRVLGRWKDKDGFKVDRKFGMLVRGFSATLPQSQIASLAADPDVASVKPLKVFYQSMQTAGELTQSVAAREDLGVDGRGLVVSVIDSGIDVKHQDMRLDDDVQGRLPAAEGFTEKVPYGWNFADDNADVYDTGSEHGMHVAGIVAANGGADADVIANGRIRGIAPNAQLLAMKVFSNDPAIRGAYEDDIIAAIEESVERGANIINMSLGSPNGTNQSSVGEGRAIANAQAAGVQVIVAAGNEGHNGSPGGTLDDVFDMLDDGTMGSPASTKEALAVASVNNTASIATVAKIAQGGTSEDIAYQLQTGVADDAAHVIVDGGLGKPDQIPATAKGNYVLVERGEISFADKFNNAIAKGAVGVVVFNSAAGGDTFAGMGGLDHITIPGLFLHRTAGLALKAKIAAGETTITLTDGRVALPTSEPVAPSSFTSWGATPELDFKPQLAGIGGSVYSTNNDDEYADNSGTSMAAPHVAGAFALGAQKFAERFPDLSAKDRNALLRVAFSNTAKILEHDGVPYAPRQMGAGLIQTKSALSTDVFATVDGSPTIALREVRGPKQFTVTLENRGGTDRTFTVGGTCSVAESQDPAGNTTACSTIDSIKSATSKVTVPAGGKATVDFTVTPGSGDHWLQGWASFKSADGAQPDLALPYLGFAGDWNAEPIVDAPRVGGEPLLDQLIGADHETATTLLGNFPIVGAVPRTWFSPNGDGIYDEVFPSVSMLRSASDLEYEILSDGKVLKSLGSDRDVQRLTIGDILGTLGSAAHVASAQKWDGRVYDPSSDTFVDAPDGKYTLRIKARLGAEFAWQHTDLEFGLDRVAPTVESLTRVQNADGSLTYTLKTSDDASGIFWRALTTVRGTTQVQHDRVIDEATGTVTITVPADQVGPGEYLDVQVMDNAGNVTRVTDFQGRDAVQLFHEWRYDRWVNSWKYDVTDNDQLVKDGKVHLTVTGSPNVTHATVNGAEVTMKDGFGSIDVPVTAGRNDFEIIGFAADGSEVGRTTNWLGLDDVAPVFEFTDLPLNASGELVPDAQGKITIKGKLTDNVSKTSDWSLIGFDAASNILMPDAQGNFTYETTPGPDQITVTLAAVDHSGRLNYTSQAWPIAGRTAAASQLRITYDDPRLQPVDEDARFGEFATIVDPSFENLTISGTTAQLRLKGTFNARPGKFIVAGKEVAIDDKLHFDVPITLNGGINHVGFEVVDANGNRAIMGSWRFFWDRNLPGYEMVTVPGIDADGAIYLTSDGQEVSVEGAVWDDEFGYELAINGSTVKEFDNLWDPGATQNRREFETKVTGKGGETMRVSLSDQIANGVERAIPFVLDEAAPSVAISGVKDGDVLDGSHRITVRATDPNVKSVTVLVDGKEYVGKVVEARMHPDAYVVPFLNGEPQLDALDASDGTPLETELVVEVTGLAAGRHVLEAVGVDKAGRSTVEAVTFVVDAAAPVIDGPDALSVDPDGDVLAQIRDAYTVTDDVDEDLQVQVDVDGLVLDQPTKVTLVAVDASGKVTERVVTITLERPLTTLGGECGSMTARFAKGDSISITCTKQADGSVIVNVQNKGIAVTGTLTLTVTGSPVYLLDDKGKVLRRVEFEAGKGTITLESSSKAIYRIGALPEGKQPIDGHRPGHPVNPPGMPRTGN